MIENQASPLTGGSEPTALALAARGVMRRLAEQAQRLPAPARIALGASAVGLMAGMDAASLSPQGHPFILLFVAVILSTVLFRWEGGVASLFAGTLYSDYFYLGDEPGLGFGIPDDLFAIAAFLLAGGYSILVVHSQHSAVKTLACALQAAQDARDRAAASEREKDVLVREFNHRVKNTLSTVASIARQSLATSRSLEEFGSAFESRIDALSKATDLLAKGGYRDGASLRDVVSAELQPYGRATVEVIGPDIVVAARAALNIALVIHELATNAAKYGGLRNKDGRLVARWTVSQADDLISLDWIETHPDPQAPTSRKGFGSRLIDFSIRSLGGEIVRDYTDTGLRCQLSFPIHAVTGQGAPS